MKNPNWAVEHRFPASRPPTLPGGSSMKNPNWDVDRDVSWAVFGAVGRALSGDVRWAVHRAVDVAVDWAVVRAVDRAVVGASNTDSPHPALQDFLGEAL
jgi:hypothetical protein